MGDKRYTLGQYVPYGNGYPLQVGQDFPVVEVNDKTVKVSVTDERGKQRTETLNVVTVEKVNCDGLNDCATWATNRTK